MGESEGRRPREQVAEEGRFGPFSEILMVVPGPRLRRGPNNTEQAAENAKPFFSGR
jgi:hypothetical protein